MKLDELLEAAEAESSNQSHPERVPEEKWRYACSKEKPMLTEGREIKMQTDKGVFAGKFVRDMIEARRYRPESYTWLGHTESPKRGIQEVGIPHRALFKHTAIFGNSGYGKSTVMKNMMLQWAQAGFGLCFIDPKGDDSGKLLRTMPEHRKDDIIWVEPGATDKRESVGFNVLETLAEPGTPEQEAEADAVIEDLVGIFESVCTSWSPQIKGAATTILGQMIRAKEDYTLVDFYKVLDSPAEREAFVDMYGEDMDNMDREYVENIEPAEVQPLTQQLKQIISRPMTREILATPNANASLADAIENDKIVICDFSNISDDNLEFLAAAFVRRIWSTIKARKDIPEPERDPFFLCLDEFDNQTKDFQDAEGMMHIGEILSQARAFKLSVMLANQNPTQLAEDIKQEVYGNCNNLFTFNQGNFQDASDLAQPLKDLDARQIMDLSEFRLLGKLTINGDKTPGLLIHTFPEYPPLRSEDEALQLLNESTKRYGVENGTGEFNEDDYGVIRYRDVVDAGGTLAQGDENISLRHVLAAVVSGEHNPEVPTLDDAVAESGLKHLLDQHADAFSYDDIKSTILTPQLNNSFEEVTDESGDPYYRLTADGRAALADEFDSDHAPLALETLECISDEGYFTTTPTHEGDTLHYDFIAHPPIDPVAEAETMEMAERLEATMEAAYPDVYERFRDLSLAITVIPCPLDHPRRILQALVAADESRHCVFAVPDQTANGYGGREAMLELLTEEGETPPLIHAETDGQREFYTTDQPVDVASNARGLHRSDDARWKEDSEGNLVLADGDGSELASFPSFDAIDREAQPDDFPYYAVRAEEGIGVLRTEDDGEDTLVEEYETFEEAFDDGFNLVCEPLIPETSWPTPDSPPRGDEWTTLIIPSDGRDPEFL